MACCVPGPCFSRVAVSGWGVVVDYRPRRVDLGALRSGALTEARSVSFWGYDVGLILDPDGGGLSAAAGGPGGAAQRRPDGGVLNDLGFVMWA